MSHASTTSWRVIRFLRRLRASKPLALAGAAAAVAVAAGGVATAALVAEERDSACALCHLPPEVAYVARSQTAPPADLASAHAAVDPAVRCIDCHAGSGGRDRTRGLALAAADTWSWLRGAYVVVGDEYAPLGTSRKPWAKDSCVSCHADVFQGMAFDRHFHELLDDPAAPVVPCASCHAAHAPRPGERAFMTDDDARAGCNACHRVMGGPSGPVTPAAQPTPAR